MSVILKPWKPYGTVTVPVSKSELNRLLLCAALTKSETAIKCNTALLSGDIICMLRCLETLGAKITTDDAAITVTGGEIPSGQADFHCGDSGAVLRFLVPVAAALGLNARFFMSERLAERVAADPFHADKIVTEGYNPIRLNCQLHGDRIKMSGSVTSQFISGLAMALPLIGGGIIEIENGSGSAPYIAMTLAVLRDFGISAAYGANGNEIIVEGNYRAPGTVLTANGDYSSASYFLAAGAFSDSGVCCRMLSGDRQGDSAIIGYLRDFGADVTVADDSVTVKKHRLNAIRADLNDTPDLVPTVAVLAAVAEGTSVLKGISRLKYKESDRISSVCGLIKSLGGDIDTDGEMFVIRGGELRGGKVSCYGDHRIVMAAALASAACSGDVIPDCDNIGELAAKSYPGFLDDYISTGGKIIQKMH